MILLPLSLVTVQVHHKDEQPNPLAFTARPPLNYLNTITEQKHDRLGVKFQQKCRCAMLPATSVLTPLKEKKMCQVMSRQHHSDCDVATGV